MITIFTMEKKVKLVIKLREVIKQIPTIKETLIFSYEKNEIVDKKNFKDFNKILDKSELDEKFKGLSLIIQFIFYIQAVLLGSQNV